MESLQKGYHTYNGWRDLVGPNESKIDLLTEYDIYQIRRKCRCISTALCIALKRIHLGSTWLDCCKKTVNEIQELEGDTMHISYRMIQCWHASFRQNNESFWTYTLENHTISYMSPILEANPDFSCSIIQYAKDNLSAFNIETLHERKHLLAIPCLLKQIRKEMRNNNEISNDEEFTKK